MSTLFDGLAAGFLMDFPFPVPARFRAWGKGKREAVTSGRDRKSIVRLLIEQVLVKVDESEWVDVVVRWAGGRETSARMRRPVAKLTSLSAHEQLLGELGSLRRAGLSATEIATKLNEAGWVTPTQRNTFNERLVRAMILRYGPMPRGPRQLPSDGHGTATWP